MKAVSKAHAILLGLALIAVAAMVAVFGNAFATRAYLDQAATRGETTLRLAISALRGHMSRFEPLPALIADHDDIKAVVADPANVSLRNQANAYLKEINQLLKSSDIYVMLASGDTIVSSNYDAPLSFVGQNFNYRPTIRMPCKASRGDFSHSAPHR